MRLNTAFPLIVCLAVGLLASACSGGSNPTGPSAPAPTTGLLAIKLDASCLAMRTLSGDVYVDGNYVGTVTSGQAVTQTVTIGQHNVEGESYFVTTGQVQRRWGPQVVSVPAAGFTELFYCT